MKRLNYKKDLLSLLIPIFLGGGIAVPAAALQSDNTSLSRYAAKEVILRIFILRLHVRNQRLKTPQDWLAIYRN